MAATGSPARGSATVLALGHERSCGVPAGVLTQHAAIPPVALPLVHGESADPSLDPNGYRRRGMPNPISGDGADVGIPTSTAGSLDFLYHVVGGVTKQELEVGAVRQYDFTPPALGDRPATTLWGYLAPKPAERSFRYGIAFGQLTMAIAAGGVIPMRLSGQVSHGTELGIPEPDAGNTGTYTLGPFVRGPVADESSGDVYVRVTQISPLQVKVERAPDPPTFPGAAIDLVVDAAGDGVYTALQDETGVDLGVLTPDVKDPLEIVFPGTAADHAALAVGDTWRVRMPNTFADPTMTVVPATGRLRMAHWDLRARDVGAPTWQTRTARGGTVTIFSPVETSGGNGTDYPVSQDRVSGEDSLTVQLNAKFVDRYFGRKISKHDRLEMQLELLGHQIGSGQHRNSLLLDIPVGAVTQRTRAIGGPGVIEEVVTISGETDDAGSPPYSIRVKTTRDWSPPA